MRQYTRDLYARLEAETGQATGLRQCGFIELATDADRLEEYRRVDGVQPALRRRRARDLARAKSPICSRWPGSMTCWPASTSPDDGRVNPVDVTMALAKGARMRGVTIIEGVPVTGFTRERGAVTGVRTAHGDIEAEYVVNCAGMWARQLGELAGVTIPLQAAEHYYLHHRADRRSRQLAAGT